MEDSNYRKPFPNIRSAVISLSLMFLAIISVAVPFGNLNRFLSDDAYSNIGMYAIYYVMSFVFMTAASMLGYKASRHVMTIFFIMVMILSITGHVYFMDGLNNVHIYLFLFSLAASLVATYLVNTETNRMFVDYRKKHWKFVRELNK